ncbi:MAG: methylated-DNA--[protein]-cysteine S-methyltransferase [Haloferacaceae archaeon]
MEVDAFGVPVALDEAALAAPEERVRAAVRAYLDGERRAFDVGVRYPDGLTGRTMRAMEDIPYGETRTYGDLAASLGTSPVAVGQACGRNPVPLVVPCHRVVAADGLGGFSAGGSDGRWLKRRLLAHERGQRTLADCG